MLAIISNTLKEFIRNKIIYIILGTSIFLILLSFVLSDLALSEENKIILDFSLSVIEIFGLITTLFLGSWLIYNELHNNTILIILSKSPSRTKFVLGKFIGFALLLFITYFILSIAFLFVIFFNNMVFEFSYIVAIFFSYIKILIILGFIVLFSSFVGPFLSLLLSFCIYFIAHMTSFVKFYLIKREIITEGSFAHNLVNIIYYLFPNFHDLSMKEYLISPYLGAYDLTHILLTTFAGFIYLFILLFITILIFNKKEF